ncbi:MAG: thioredoxin [Gammaproteobacteria bacterium]|nr:MAG: thioredoxin [Gammaproteobacteria bacterium]
MNAPDPAVSAILNVGLDDFETEVVAHSHHRPVLVDFWAAWCSPCLVIAPVLAEVVDAWDGALRLAKVEVDEGENMKLAGRYAVRGFPTVILFEHGEESGRFSGARSANWIEEFLEEHSRMLGSG